MSLIYFDSFNRLNPVTKIMEAYVSGKEKVLRISFTWAVVLFMVMYKVIFYFCAKRLFIIYHYFLHFISIRNHLPIITSAKRTG